MRAEPRLGQPAQQLAFVFSEYPSMWLAIVPISNLQVGQAAAHQTHCLWQPARLWVLSYTSMIPDCSRSVKQWLAAFGVGAILSNPSQYVFAALECSDVLWPAEHIERFSVSTPAPIVMLRRADQGLLSLHDG